MIRGHRLLLKMKIPFSTDEMSAGSPFSCHFINYQSSHKILDRVQSSPTGISYLLHSLIHSSMSSYLQLYVKGPRYEMQADAISIFPVKLLRNYINMAKLYFHRTASPVRPIKSFSALLNFISASSCWDLRTCALRDEVSSLRCNSDTIS